MKSLVLQFDENNAASMRLIDQVKALVHGEGGNEVVVAEMEEHESFVQIRHYGLWYEVLAAFPETERNEANAYMEKHPGAAVLCIRAGTVYLADQQDEGSPSPLPGRVRVRDDGQFPRMAG